MAVKRRVQVSTLRCDNGVVPPAGFILPQIRRAILWSERPGHGLPNRYDPGARNPNYQGRERPALLPGFRS